MQYPMRCNTCGHTDVLVLTVAEYSNLPQRCTTSETNGCPGIMERYYPKDSVPYNSIDALPSKNKLGL